MIWWQIFSLNSRRLSVEISRLARLALLLVYQTDIHVARRRELLLVRRVVEILLKNAQRTPGVLERFLVLVQLLKDRAHRGIHRHEAEIVRLMSARDRIASEIDRQAILVQRSGEFIQATEDDAHVIVQKDRARLPNAATESVSEGSSCQFELGEFALNQRRELFETVRVVERDRRFQVEILAIDERQVNGPGGWNVRQPFDVVDVKEAGRTDQVLSLVHEETGSTDAGVAS